MPEIKKNAAETTAETNGAEAEKTEKEVMNKGPFASLDELNENPVGNGHYKPFTVFDDGGEVMGYVWARDYDRALAVIARDKGWSAKSAGKTETADSLAEKASKLTPEQRKELLKLLKGK